MYMYVLQSENVYSKVQIQAANLQNQKFKNFYEFLADRTNGRAYATVLRLSSVCLSVCDVMYCG